MRRLLKSFVKTATPALGLLVACGIHAQTTTRWAGSVSTNWFTAGNWDNGVPDEGYAVIIPNTTTKPTMPAGRYPASGRFDSFEVQSGAIVKCTGDPSVVNEDSGGTESSPYGTGRLDRQVASWGRVLAWTDRAMEVSGLDSTNTANYTLTGLSPNQKVTVTVNGEVQDELTTGDENGTLAIRGVPLSPQTTVSVTLVGRGTVWVVR